MIFKKRNIPLGCLSPCDDDLNPFYWIFFGYCKLSPFTPPLLLQTWEFPFGVWLDGGRMVLIDALPRP